MLGSPLLGAGSVNLGCLAQTPASWGPSVMACDLRRHRALHDVTVMLCYSPTRCRAGPLACPLTLTCLGAPNAPSTVWTPGPSLQPTRALHPPTCAWIPTVRNRADSRFALSQWETALLCNDVSHWLGASLDSTLRNIAPVSQYW